MVQSDASTQPGIYRFQTATAPARLDRAWLAQAHDATESSHGPAWIFADGGGRRPDLGPSDIDAIPLLRDLIEGRTQDVALTEDQGRDLGLLLSVAEQQAVTAPPSPLALTGFTSKALLVDQNVLEPQSAAPSDQ